MFRFRSRARHSHRAASPHPRYTISPETPGPAPDAWHAETTAPTSRPRCVPPPRFVLLRFRIRCAGLVADSCATRRGHRRPRRSSPRRTGLRFASRGSLKRPPAGVLRTGRVRLPVRPPGRPGTGSWTGGALPPKGWGRAILQADRLPAGTWMTGFNGERGGVRSANQSAQNSGRRAPRDDPPGLRPQPDMNRPGLMPIRTGGRRFPCDTAGCSKPCCSIDPTHVPRQVLPDRGPQVGHDAVLARLTVHFRMQVAAAVRAGFLLFSPDRVRHRPGASPDPADLPAHLQSRGCRQPA